MTLFLFFVCLSMAAIANGLDQSQLAREFLQRFEKELGNDISLLSEDLKKDLKSGAADPDVHSETIKHLGYETHVRRISSGRLEMEEAILGSDQSQLAQEFLQRFEKEKDLKSGAADPELHMTTPEIIKHWGYPTEEHWVTTDDGYILGLHRIPPKENKAFNVGNNNNERLNATNSTRPVVFLQHGLLCSSSNWVSNLPHQSLGFILADSGFDVWMGNNRGNTYSTNHTDWSTKSSAFWQFSWPEMADHDLPAMVDYVLKVTGQSSLHYIGHSQGSMIMFAKSSIDVDGSFSAKIRSFTALGPVTQIGHMKSPVVRFLAKIESATNLLKWMFNKLGRYDFLPNNWMINLLSKIACETRLSILCSNFMFLVMGSEHENLNITRIPVYFNHAPAGTSLQNMIHFAQMYNGKEWNRYDWGWKKNHQIYGQMTPPHYDPTNVKVPVHVFYGEKDVFTTVKDVEWLLSKLPNLVESTYDPAMDHLAYIWGLNARDRVYKRILANLQQYE